MVVKYPWIHALLPLSFALFSVANEDSASSKACQLLNDSLPGLVFFPGSSNFTNDNFHYGASSTQNSTCTVEPATNDHISTILGVIGREDIRSPFAVKSGGHSSNVGFSSTTGVMISMAKFNQINNDPSTGTVEIGPGTTWDQVYTKLEALNLTVVGGRIPGVGVGGLLLGGGYSWYTDEFGLAVDNIVSYDLVLPNGTFIKVTDSSHPDLSFALKGGFNNFGVVTSFTVRTHPDNGIWAGTVTFPLNVTDRVFDAVENLSINNNDSNTAVILTYTVITGGQTILVADLFNDAPQQPAVFDEILGIPSINSTVSARSLTDFLLEDFAFLLLPQAGYTQHVVPIVHYTVPILQAMKTGVDATFAQAMADGRSVSSVGMNCELFIHPFAHSVDSAYPHPQSRQVTPGNPLIFYSDLSDADYFSEAVFNLSQAVGAVAIGVGESLANDIRYPNYALPDTPLELIYGENLGRLRAIKRRVDPTDIMGLSGGFKI